MNIFTTEIAENAEMGNEQYASTNNQTNSNTQYPNLVFGEALAKLANPVRGRHPGGSRGPERIEKTGFRLSPE